MYPEVEWAIENAGGRRGILVVDPDPGIPEALGLALRQRAQVHWTTSGLAGLMMVAEHEVDLAVIEADIPDMPLAGFLRTLRLLRPGLPIAVLGTQPHLQDPKMPEPDVRFSKPLDLKLLLAWITDRLAQGPSRPSGVESPPPAWEVPLQHLEVVRAALEFIERLHWEEARLAVIAQAAGASRSHLCRIFKRVTGISLKRFLTRRRLQAAKELLQEPGLSIREVARWVGFRDASHFNRVFRQWEGLTPSGFRRQAILRGSRSGIPPATDSSPTTCPPWLP